MRPYARWWLIVLVSIAGSTRTCWAADTDAVRGYLGLRVGGAPLFSHAGKDSAITLENPGAEALGGAVLGVHFDKHWGVELAGEREKTGLTQESTGRKTAEYAWYTLLAQARWVSSSSTCSDPIRRSRSAGASATSTSTRSSTPSACGSSTRSTRGLASSKRPKPL